MDLRVHLVLLILLLMVSETESRSVHRSQPIINDSKEFWLRNKCSDGFVTVVNSTVVAKEVTKYDHVVRLRKEIVLDDLQSEKSQMRLFSVSSGKYICLNQCGWAVAVHPDSVRSWGDLCTFVELPVTAYEVSLQSVFNSTWYLSFSSKYRQVFNDVDGARFSPPICPQEQGSPGVSCERLFSTSQYKEPKKTQRVLLGLWNILNRLN